MLLAPRSLHACKLRMSKNWVKQVDFKSIVEEVVPCTVKKATTNYTLSVVDAAEKIIKRAGIPYP